MSIDKRTIKPERPHIEHINESKIAHMVGVAEWMRERAKDYGLNPDVMYAIGLLHDVGYLQGREGHEQRGAEILSAIGIDEDIRFAIAHHGENPYKVQNEYGKDVITPEFVLMVEADLSVDAKGYRIGFDKRIKDLKERYGNEYKAGDVEETISFIKEYQKEHNICKPTKLFHANLHHDFTKGVDYKKFWTERGEERE